MTRIRVDGKPMETPGWKVREIREMRSKGRSLTDIAREMEVSTMTVQRLCKRNKWERDGSLSPGDVHDLLIGWKR